MKDNFNVGNPTKENIEYAFKNLIFYVTSSSVLDLYINQREDFKNVLSKINSIIATYVNNENLSAIDEEILKDIRFDLIDLDVQTQPIKSYFAEWSLLWIDAIISLRESKMKLGGINNEW